MISSATTIQQTKEEISLLLVDLDYIINCHTEFDDDLKVDKIVITVNDWLNEKHLRDLLKPYSASGHRIVFRKQKPLFPFVE